jgi:tetratricopeptide (TPR) repeat protein
MNLHVQAEDNVRLRRNGAEQAVALALESKWEEAAALNRQILTSFPADVESWNRLGKALIELGRFRDARDAYQKSSELDPVNKIAKRNLDRLSSVRDDDEPRRSDAVGKVAQDLFIEETGKSGSTVLQQVSVEMLARTVAGDEVYLKPEGTPPTVQTAQGEQLGMVEPKLGHRLLRLMQGGNRYAAAVKSVTEGQVEVIIKEIFRDPSQTRLSFPAVAEGVRSYTRDSLLRYDNDEEDDDLIEDEAEQDDWEGEADTTDNTVSLSSLKDTMDVDDEDDEDGN